MFKNLKTNCLEFIYLGWFFCLDFFRLGLGFFVYTWFCLFIFLLVFLLVVCFFPDSLTES